MFAIFFTFLAGFSVFTAERAFPVLISGPVQNDMELKNSWSETEAELLEIESVLANRDWPTLDSIFNTRPHFLSPTRILYLEGVFRFRLGQINSAERLLWGAIRLGYRGLDGYLTLAGLFYQTHRFEHALKVYKELLRRGEQDTRIYKGLAGTFFQLQNYEKSIYFYKKVLEKANRDPSVYNNMGVAYLKLGEYSQAKINFLKAISLEPQFLEAKKNLQLIP